MKLTLASCTALLALTTTAAHANLLNNGSFELGLTGWSSAGPVSVRSDQQPSDGASSLVFDYGVGMFGNEVTQALTLRPGTTYTLELDYWGWGATTQHRLLINVSLFNTTVNGYISIFNAEVFPTSAIPADYRTFTGSFTVPQVPSFPLNTPTIVWLKDLTPAANGVVSDLNIDRVSLVAVPEPAVYAQLALGLLVFLGLRVRALR
jgi:hypothetical protein